MLAARITCPRCGQQLTVTENAPPRVTCPVCLAALVNPASPDSGVPRPVPVIPLDRQVAWDTRLITWLIYALFALLMVMAVVTIAAGNPRNGMFMILVAGGLITFLYFFGEIRADAKGPPSPLAESAGPPVPAEPGQPVVLQYGARRPVRPGATAGAVAAGFFSAIGVCGLCFYVLAATADWNGGGGGAAAKHNAHAMILGGVVIAILAFLAVTVHVGIRWRGFAAGGIAGLCLGLVALGPCAACYLLTL